MTGHIFGFLRAEEGRKADGTVTVSISVISGYPVTSKPEESGYQI